MGLTRTFADRDHASGLIVRAAFCAALILLAAGIALGITYTWADLGVLARPSGSTRRLIGWVLAATAVSGTFATAWYLARRDHPIRPAFFIGGLILVTLLVRAFLIFTIEPTWTTDYLRYWERALELAASEEISVTNLYLQRALLIPYPVAAIFGPDAVDALKWANAILLLLSQLIAYDVIRLTSNHQAAQASSLLLAASPLPAYAALIPSHDIWAVFFLAVALWASTRLWFHPLKTALQIASGVLLTLLCAVSVYALELQRSIGTMLSLVLVAISLALLAAGKQSNNRTFGSSRLIFVAMLSVLLLQAPLGAFGRQVGIEHTPTERQATLQAIKLAAHGSAMGTARSAWFARFNERFDVKFQQPPSELGDFTQSIILSTWALQPVGKLEAMREHAARLFSLSYPTDWDTTLKSPAGMDDSVRELLIIHTGIFGLFLLTGVFLGVAALSLRPLSMSWPALVGAMLVLGLSALLLLVFENKPYNISSVWLLYPIILGNAFASGSERTFAGRHTILPLVRVSCAGLILILITGFGAWLTIKAMYGANEGRVLDHWHFRTKTQLSPDEGLNSASQSQNPRAFEPKHYLQDRRPFIVKDAVGDAERIGKRAGALYFIMRLPPGPISKGDTLTAFRELCLDGTRRNLEFLMFAPYLRKDVHRAFDLQVALDGRIVEQAPIPHANRESSMRLVTTRLTEEEDKQCYHLTFSLISNVDRSVRSWTEASHVEIWFPRLVQ